MDFSKAEAYFCGQLAFSFSKISSLAKESRYSDWEIKYFTIKLHSSSSIVIPAYFSEGKVFPKASVSDLIRGTISMQFSTR